MAGWKLLNNGIGAIDWQGLPYAVAKLGVQDVDAFIDGLQVVRYHRSASDRQQDEQGPSS